MLALFDLDNTLIDRSVGLEHWARGFVRSRSLPQETEAVICDRLRERAHPEDFVGLGAVLGLSDDPGDLWHEYIDGVARSVRCFPGAREGLEALRGAGGPSASRRTARGTSSAPSSMRPVWPHSSTACVSRGR